jgi:hypothetical protein
MSDIALSFGWHLHPMQVNDRAESDRIEHTIRHFAAADEQWERLPPHHASTPADIRNEIAANGWSLVGFSRYDPAQDRRINDPKWWRSPRREVVERAHEKGYCPRYTSLVERSGEFWMPGARWVSDPKGDGRLCSELDGYLVVVAPRQKQKRASMVTALRQPVLKGGRSGPTLGTLGDKFKAKLQALCQIREAESSQGAGVDHE